MASYINAKIQLQQGFDSYFRNEVKKEIIKKLTASINRITESIETAIQALVKDKLMTSNVVNSIAGGRLRAELGLVDGAARIGNIIETWANSVEVKYVKKLGDFGGIMVTMQDQDYANVLSMPEAEFITEKGVVLEWLRWLLIEGNNKIVSSHFFKSSTRGRTGSGIMVERQGASWKVPKQFAGTDNDNFATRALEDIQDDIDVIIRREITKVI